MATKLTDGETISELLESIALGMLKLLPGEDFQEWM
jgi:hypothetical protein